jgi:hypothetical protein
MATLQEDMITYFVGLGLVNATNCFSNIIPAEPDNIVVLYEYPGDPVIPYFEVVNRSIQLSVRNVNADEASQLTLSLFKALISPNLMVFFTPTRVGQVYLRQPPFKLGIDENNRTTYCFNIGITTTID